MTSMQQHAHQWFERAVAGRLCLFVFVCILPLVQCQAAYDYPHSRSYRRYVWEEYNIGRSEELDLIWDVPVGEKAAQYAAKHKSNHKYHPEPAHVKLCRAFVAPPVPPKAGKTKRLLIVEEDDSVCNGRGGSGANYHDSYGSLMRMYASALVAHVAHAVGRYDLFYQHGCGTRMATRLSKKALWAEQGTIFEFLPPYLKVKMDANPEQKVIPLIQANCGRCVLQYDEHAKGGNFDTYDPFPNCLFFPEVPFVGHVKAAADAQLLQQQQRQQPRTPTTPNTIKGAVEQGRRLQQDQSPQPQAMAREFSARDIELQPYSLVLRSLLQTIRYSMREATAEYSKILRDTNENLFKTLSVVNLGGATVYLDCESATSDRVQAIPYYLYASEISRGASRIVLLASPECKLRNTNMDHYANSLKDFLTGTFPEATVSLVYVESTSAVAFAHMVLAKQLMAPPAASSIVPMLSNRVFKTIVESPDLYPWMNVVVEILQLDRSGKGYQDHIHFVPSPLYPLTPAVHFNDVLRDLMQVQAPPGEIENVPVLHQAYVAAHCTRVRGRWGKWVQDMDYAKVAQYVTPIEGYTGMADSVFKASPEEPFRKPTTHKWIDSFQQSCPIQLLNLESFCNVMEALELEKVMFIGDSLTFHWSQSLWKLLGNEDTPTSGTQAGVDEGYHWERDVQCPDQKILELSFFRSDNLDIHTKGRESCGDNSGTCFEWESKYNDDRNKPTLLLANTGSHTSFDENFRNDFNEFFVHLDDINRQKDVVLFRTSVPGHRECLLDNLEPYHNYTQYRSTLSDSYNPYEGTDLPNINAYKAFHWDNFLPYNKYVHNLLDTRAAHLEKHPGANEQQITIEMLDVVPMTILRPDGHASSPDCRDCGLRKGNIGDCLHYSLPGPVDWWNHLMFTQLLDTQQRKERLKMKQQTQPQQQQQQQANVPPQTDAERIGKQ